MSSATVKNAFEIGEKKFHTSIISFECVYDLNSLSDILPLQSLSSASYRASLFLVIVLKISNFSRALASDLDKTIVSRRFAQLKVLFSGGSRFKTNSIKSKKF